MSLTHWLQDPLSNGGFIVFIFNVTFKMLYKTYDYHMYCAILFHVLLYCSEPYCTEWYCALP